MVLSTKFSFQRNYFESIYFDSEYKEHTSNTIQSKIRPMVLVIGMAIGLSACGGSSSNNIPPISTNDPVEAVFSTGLFTQSSATINNPYFPLVPGKTYIYEGDGERVEVSVSHEKKMILGIESVVVVDRAYEDNELVEETFDWYAQDNNGNVWYMGEDSKEYEDGKVTSSDGSWETGQDVLGLGYNASAGIKMKAPPFTVGDTYLQELYAGIAEDMAEIIAVNVEISDLETTLPGGIAATSFTTLQTLEWVPLADNPAATEEYKYFSLGIGLVLETDVQGNGRVELVEVQDDTIPNIDPNNFENSTIIDNKYFPLIPGTSYSYKTTLGEDEELIIIDVLLETREVMGITTVVVRDRVYINGDQNTGLLLEDTHDWYAQDNDGNVWYMGEEVDNYDEVTGELLDHDGSWEAGVNGAQPGLQMKAKPRTGDSYHQEYLMGEAEDLAVIVGSDIPITLADGTTYNTIKVKEWNPLAVDSTEYKYYATGVGFIREEKLDDQGTVVEAIEFLDVSITQSFEHIDIVVDNNPTEEEAQVIFSGSAEPTFFKKLACYTPNGLTLANAEIEGESDDYADFQFDSAKTQLVDLELAYPAGTYWCIGTTPDNKMIVGSTKLDYGFTDSVEPIFPANGDIDTPIGALTISWALVTGADAITIDIENSLTGASVEVDLASDATSFTLPDGLLDAGTVYEVGFEAVHQNGNKSVTEDYVFTTAGIAPAVGDINAGDFGDFESLAFRVVYNSTDDDAQAIIAAESTDATIMMELTITVPNGEIVHNVEFKDSEDLGITDVLYEISEPSIMVLEADYPAGIYVYTATFIDENELEYDGTGSATLSYDILTAPTVTFPLANSTGILVSDALTITWNGIPVGTKTIILEIEADASGKTFSVELDASATEFSLPANWMKADTAYMIDLKVVHGNGNITVADVQFSTEL